MIPIRDNQIRLRSPVVTWTIILLNLVIFLWDRQWALFGHQMVFADLTMRPQEVIGAITGGDRFPLVTVFTALFLHAGWLHLLGNMLFLLVFGPGVEEALGSPRFALYYLFWGVVATATHIFVFPSSLVPALGASGAIGGVLGCYFLLFPSNRVEIIVPLLFFIRTVVSAWFLRGLWFLWQIGARQEGVANWAHAGGFLAGMVTVLLLGGRGAVLGGRAGVLDPEFEAR
ncbi:MAG: rhomboid family intramembrane serine protease [Fimbriimonas ginsengisoli]|nr:rhomboid family intramembrane serine protease [Fimbriimonas ginsengisoli]